MSFINKKYFFLENQYALERLIILPHAGGNALSYIELGKFFSKEYEVVIIQYPGRLNRVNERNLESIKSYSDELFDLLNGSVAKFKK